MYHYDDYDHAIVQARVAQFADQTRRYLTGGDLDLESVQPIGDFLYFGEEFGPYLIKTDKSGKV